MKFNKWTLGLAAVGVVSLASVAKAEEKALQNTLSATTISGYVDTSAQWNFNASDANLPPYKFGGPGKADGFNLDVVQIRIEKALDEAEWASGYRVDLWAGPDANTLNTRSTTSTASGDFAIRQAYVALRTPVGNGLDWKVGVFDSVLGYESVESPSNPNYTRSYGHTIEPQTQTGLLATYHISDLVSASAGVADTSMMTTINGRSTSALAWMGSIAVTAPEDMGFLAGSTLYAGIENGFGGTSTTNELATSYYVGATIATPVTGLRLGTALDVLDVHHQGGETWAVAGYASYQASEKLSLHFRGEYLKDRGDQQFFALNSDKTMDLTLTAQYDLWKNVISRIELRWDHSLSGTDEFGGTVAGTPTLINAWMLGANIIYKF
jgi:hypothetical protein